MVELPAHHVDPVSLHEVVHDVPAARALLAELARDGGDELLAARVDLLRALAPDSDDPDAQLTEAERLGWRAVGLAGGPADEVAAAHAHADEVPLGAVAPVLRLAHVLQRRHRFAEADLLFGLALEATRYHGEHAASIEHARRLEFRTLYHWGLCRYEQALDVHAEQARPYLGEALALFVRAGELRVEAQATAQEVERVRRAVQAARDRLAELGA